MVAGERRASIRGWGGAVASRGIEAASARQRTMQTHRTRARYLPALLVLLTSAAATTFVLSRRGNLRRRPGPQMGGRRAADGRPITTTCPRRRIMAEWRRGSAACEAIPCVGQSRRRAGWTRAGRHAAATPARDYTVRSPPISPGSDKLQSSSVAESGRGKTDTAMFRFHIHLQITPSPRLSSRRTKNSTPPPHHTRT